MPAAALEYRQPYVNPQIALGVAHGANDHKGFFYLLQAIEFATVKRLSNKGALSFWCRATFSQPVTLFAYLEICFPGRTPIYDADIADYVIPADSHRVNFVSLQLPDPARLHDASQVLVGIRYRVQPDLRAQLCIDCPQLDVIPKEAGS